MDGIQQEAKGQWNRARARRFGVLTVLFFLVFAHSDLMESQNTLSRMVAVESLVKRGVWHIDASPYGPTWTEERDGKTVCYLNDMVCNERDGHFYSSKPPVLTMILAGVLMPLERMGAELEFTRDGARGFMFLLTWLVVGGVSAVAFAELRRKAGEMMPPGRADLITLVALGGTLFLSYSTTMNHHTITGALVLLSFFLLGMADADGSEERRAPGARRLLTAGFLMGLASVIDIGPGVAFSLGFGLYILCYLRSLRALVLFGIGSIPPLAAHCFVQYSLWGSVLPVQLLDGTKDYATSYWKAKLPPDTWRISRSYYWALTLFSARGLFVLSPVLAVGAAALVDDVRRSIRTPRRGQELAAALSVAFGILFYFIYTSFRAPTNFNGSCFGMRYYVGFMPLLAFYTVRGFARWRYSARFRRIFFALAVVSLMYALVGMQTPWELMENNRSPAVQVLMRLMRGFSA